MTTEKKVREFFIKNKWSTFLDQDNKSHFVKTVSPYRNIVINYTLRELPSGYSIFSLSEIIETELSELFSRIYQDKENREWPIEVKNFSCKLNNEEEYSNVLLILEKEILDWSSQVDSDIKIEEFSYSRPDNNLIAQIWHLTALSKLEKYQELIEYQDAFNSGNRLNFLPGVTKAMIDSALEYSIRNL